MDLSDTAEIFTQCRETMIRAGEMIDQQKQQIAALTESNNFLATELTKAMATEQKIGEVFLAYYRAIDRAESSGLEYTLTDEYESAVKAAREILGIKE